VALVYACVPNQLRPGLVFSVTTSIHPSHLGLGPDPLDGPSFGLGLSRGDQPGPDPAEVPVPQAKVSDSESWSVMSYPAALMEFLAARGSILAAQLGYLRTRPPRDGGSSRVDEAAAVEGRMEGFQCMKDLDEPVVVNGQPVLVAQPEDCHQGCSYDTTTTQIGLLIRCQPSGGHELTLKG
jgi:hypothetical protein